MKMTLPRISAGKTLFCAGVGLAILPSCNGKSVRDEPRGYSARVIVAGEYWLPADQYCRGQSTIELPDGTEFCYLGTRKEAQYPFGIVSGNSKSEPFGIEQGKEVRIKSPMGDFAVTVEEIRFSNADARDYTRVRVTDNDSGK